jgi:hypothetical protein
MTFDDTAPREPVITVAPPGGGGGPGRWEIVIQDQAAPTVPGIDVVCENVMLNRLVAPEVWCIRLPPPS